MVRVGVGVVVVVVTVAVVGEEWESLDAVVKER